MTTTALTRLAALLLLLEAVALAVITGWEVLALLGGGGDPRNSVALIVLTGLGVAGLAAFAVAVARGQSWGRSGGIVAQLLILAVTLGALTGPAPSLPFALATGLPAAVTLAVLILVSRRVGRGREAEMPDED